MVGTCMYLQNYLNPFNTKETIIGHSRVEIYVICLTFLF